MTGKPYNKAPGVYRKLTKAAGLDKLTAKDMRHNFISWTDQETAATTRQVIGHADLETTMRYYHSDRKGFENGVVSRMFGVQFGDKRDIPEAEAPQTVETR